MTKLFSREGAERLKKRVIEGDSERGQRLAGGLLYQINAIHSIDYFPDYEIEKLLLEQQQMELNEVGKRFTVPEDLIYFSPSGASKCGRELFFKANKEAKDEVLRYPYQRRWTRNASAVHQYFQRDLLYCEKLLGSDRVFDVKRMDNGLPCWENNIKTWKKISHNGVDFYLYGMCDGLLTYLPDGSTVGLEFKTKSTTLGAVGTFKLKEPAFEHKQQAIAYSILFGVDEFIFVYESLAKDGWTKGADAKPDIRTFYFKVEEEDRQNLLDRLSNIAKQYYADTLPVKEEGKCLFCPYKAVCEQRGE